MHNKIKGISAVAVGIFLCCYFMQLFNFPNTLTMLFGGIAILAMMLKQKRIRVDLSTVLIVVTIASYFIIVHGQRAFTMSLSYVSIIIFVLAYYLGCEVREKNNYEILYITLLFCIVIGFSIRGALNSYLFLDGQFQYPNHVRIWKDIWADWYMPGTWQVIFFLPMLALIFPSIAYLQKMKWMSAVLIVGSVFFVYIAMASETRTPIVILPLIVLGQMILYIILEWEKVKKLVTFKNMMFLLMSVVLILGIAFFILKDSELVIKFISIMGRDGGILKNVRFQLHRIALEQVFEYPMGGGKMSFPYPHAHAHNTWLDMAYMAGVIPFFGFLAYTLITIIELIKWLFKNEISKERKVITVGLYGVFFLYFMIERSFVGSVHYMTPWLFVTGLIHGELVAMKSKLKR